MGKKLTIEEKIERFWESVEYTPYCWLWKGSINNCGYGQGKSVWPNIVPAHRTAYTLEKGEIPSGMQIDHLCSVRNCVNPAHLEAVTKRENARRMVERKGWVHGGKKPEPRYMIGVAAKPLPNLVKIGECRNGHVIASIEDVRFDTHKDGREHQKCRECLRNIRKKYNKRVNPPKEKRQVRVPKKDKPRDSKVRAPWSKSKYPHVYWDAQRRTWVGRVHLGDKVHYAGSSDDPRKCSRLVEEFKKAHTLL